MIQRVALTLAAAVAATNACAAESGHAGKRLAYNNPGLVVDLGVGLWANPFPMDWDGDGDTDLLAATNDVPHNGVYFFENVGTGVFEPGKRIAGSERNLTVSYPGGAPVVCAPGRRFDVLEEGFSNPKEIPFEQTFYAGRANQWKYADYDGDGLFDLLIGVSDWREYGWDDAFNEKGEWIQGPLRGYVYWAKNTGNNESPEYAEAVQLAAAGRPMEVYGCPSPNLVDWDGDGDMDMICGEFLDRISFFENIGTRTRPEYAESKFLNARGDVIQMELQMLQVVVFDWDVDGDPDVVVGQEDGRVAWIENKGPGADGLPQLEPPRFLRQRADRVKCGALVTPCAVDWDADGDTDLICGNTAGFIEYIENLGGDPPAWAAPVRLEAAGETFRIMAGPNGSIQGPAEAKWGYTVPFAADWNMDGLPDIVFNTIVGKIMWLENTGTATSPDLSAAKPVRVQWDGPPPKPAWNWWNPAENELAVQWRTRPVVLDLNGDGLNDLIVIDHEGYLAFFERVRENGELAALPGKRVFMDENGEPLRLNEREAGGSGRRKLDLADWDGDGDLDILINSPRESPPETRNIAYYENVKTEDVRMTFRYRGDITEDGLEGHTTSPTAADWNGDGVLDLLVGGEDGFFYYYPRESADEMTGAE